MSSKKKGNEQIAINQNCGKEQIANIQIKTAQYCNSIFNDHKIDTIKIAQYCNSK